MTCRCKRVTRVNGQQDFSQNSSPSFSCPSSVCCLLCLEQRLSRDKELTSQSPSRMRVQTADEREKERTAFVTF